MSTLGIKHSWNRVPYGSIPRIRKIHASHAQIKPWQYTNKEIMGIDSPKVLGPADSLRFIQKGLERIETARALGKETVNRRKKEILVNVVNQKATLAQIEIEQGGLKKAETIIILGAVLLLLFELGKGGLGLVRLLFQKGKRVGIELDTGHLSERVIQRSAKHSIARRSHPRQWHVFDMSI